MSGHSPLSQFEVFPLIKIIVGNRDLSFTNASLFMMIASIIGVVFLLLSSSNAKLIPSRLQSCAEMIYSFVEGMISDTIGLKGMKFMPLIFSIFIFILLCNGLGMMPYSFTVTSHIIVTFAIALSLFIFTIMIGIIRNGFGFFSHFCPKGIPLVIMPIIMILDIISFLTRPFTLALRLALNMVVGHVLIKVVAGFSLILGLIWAWVPILFVVLLNGLELFVAILQAYVFTMLVCVYLGEMLNLH